VEKAALRTWVVGAHSQSWGGDDGLMVQIPAGAPAVVDGRLLFGSVTNFDHRRKPSASRASNHTAQVRMLQGPLKSVGDSQGTLALHSDVVVEIPISVLSDARVEFVGRRTRRQLAALARHRPFGRAEQSCWVGCCWTTRPGTDRRSDQREDFYPDDHDLIFQQRCKPVDRKSRPPTNG